MEMYVRCLLQVTIGLQAEEYVFTEGVDNFARVCWEDLTNNIGDRVFSFQVGQQGLGVNQPANTDPAGKLIS